MGSKTLYVKDADEHIWKKAEDMIKEKIITEYDSVSQMAIDLISGKINEVETIRDAGDGMKKLSMEFENKDGEIKKFSFIGEWIVEEVPEDRQGFDYGMEYSIATTKKGQFLVMYRHKNNFEGAYHIFKSFDDLQDKAPCAAISRVAEYLGIDYEIFLDI